MFSDSESDSSSDSDSDSEYSSDLGFEDYEYDNEEITDEFCREKVYEPLCSELFKHKKNIYYILFPDIDENTDNSQDVNVVPFYSEILNLIFENITNIIQKNQPFDVFMQFNDLKTKYNNTDDALTNSIMDEIKKINTLITTFITNNPNINTNLLIKYIEGQFHTYTFLASVFFPKNKSKFHTE